MTGAAAECELARAVVLEQDIGDQGEGEDRIDLGMSSQLDLGETGRALGPSEHLLDALAAALADLIAGVACGALVYRRCPRLAGLGEMPVDRDMRGDGPFAQILDELTHIIGLVGAERDAAAPLAPLQHRQRRHALGGAASLGDATIHRQAVAILH